MAVKTQAAPPPPPALDLTTVVANAVPMIADLASSAEPNAGAQVEAPRSAEPAAAGAVAQKAKASSAAGAAKDVVRSASVAVPRSYFVQIYLRASHKTEEPDDALLQPIVDAHLVRIRGLVKNALGLISDQSVAVEMYDDGLSGRNAVTAVATTPAPASVVSPVGLAMNLNQYAKQIALTTLAAVTVLALSIVLRRSPAPAGAAVGAPVVAAEPAHLSEAPLSPGESRAVLSGTLEDTQGGDDAEAHHLFRRVRDMVHEKPDEAARVLRGWIYQDER
jgi:flagellar biosynthesis/type III secretory pathway M-ring protein FliF/YscJ